MPLLYKTADTLYNLATSRLPEKVQEKDMALAPMLGFLGAYLATDLIGKVLDSLEADVPPEKKITPMLEKAGIAGLVVGTAAYVVKDTPGLKKLMGEKSVYIAGVTFAGFGAIAKALRRRHKRSLEERLDKAA